MIFLAILIIIYMAKQIIINNQVFLDTSYIIALVSPQDNLYQKAMIIAELLEKNQLF